MNNIPFDSHLWTDRRKNRTYEG